MDVRPTAGAQTSPVSPSALGQALDHLADSVLLCQAWFDAAATPVDVQVVWSNARARAAHPGRSDLRGLRWTELFPACGQDGTLQAALTVLVHGGSADGEIAGHDDGTGPRRWEFHAEALPDATLLWVLRDVSDRHRAAVELADGERRLRRALIKLQGLQDVTAALGGAMTVTDVAQVVTDITFDVLGVAGGGLALLDPRRETLTFRRLSGVTQAWARRWSTLSMAEDTPLSAAVRERHPVYLRDRRSLQERWPALYPSVPGEGRAVLPLIADDPLGVIFLVWEQVKDFSDSERLFLSTMAAQCALALARVQLFEAQASAARDLQHALLPGRLPELDGVECAARYYTADGDAVGGDWYDMFALPGGGIGLVIGDVEGHSTAAAAIMGQARNVIRAYSAETNTPAEVLSRAGRFLALHTDVLVTCCYLELRPEQHTLTVASAGHPAPVITELGGHSWQLEVTPGPPLGVLEDHAYDERTVLVPRGSSLTLFTDGLVEAHPRRPHPGMPELLAASGRAAGRPPGEVADVLAELIGDQPAADDTALLVVRLIGDRGLLAAQNGSAADPDSPDSPGSPDDEDPGARATRVFGRSRSAIPAARHFVRDILLAWGHPMLVEWAELVVSELVTNAVTHTAGRVELTLHRKDHDVVWIGVRDDSERPPRRQSAGSDDVAGRGLTIVAQLADRWGVDPSPTGSGKVVWLELGHRVAGHVA